MTPEKLEKQRRFYTLVILLPVLVGIIWLLIGAFSMLLGFGSVSADWQDPPAESNYFANDLITGIVDVGASYNAGWDQYTITCANGDEYFFKQETEFWDEGLEAWQDVGTSSVGTYPCEQNGGNWYYKWNVSYIKFLFQKAVLTGSGVGYYRGNLFVDDDFGAGDPYILVYWDEVDLVLSGDYSPPPLVPRIWATSPASETEITDLETAFEFSWEDLDDWDTMSILFQNRDTGIFSESVEYIIETTSPSGSLALTFENFNFDRNAVYYFYGVATRLGIEFIEGMYLTGRYSVAWSEDLVDPESWYLINIAGAEQMFAMGSFEEWYFSISKFATPTDMFVSIAGFFNPIFGTIGEFGNRIKDYFNLSEVYSQGYEIGKTIPYFTFFVAQVSMFYGGFPILKWLSIIILLLIGIFIFRLVLKFIPFLGGS